MNKSVFLPYPEFIQTHTPVLFRNPGTNRLSLKCAPICLCIFLSPAALFACNAAARHCGEDTLAVVTLLENLARSSSITHAALMFLKVEMLTKEPFSVWQKGADLAGDAAPCPLLGELNEDRSVGTFWLAVHFRALFREASVPLWLLAEASPGQLGSLVSLFLNLLSFPCLVGREGEKDHLFLG